MYINRDPKCPFVARTARPSSAGRRSVRSSRRGFSLILVMLVIGFSLALTYGFMRTQVTSLQLSQNDVRRDLALEAARSGISAGLLRMQDPAWVGVTDTYSKTTQQDSANLVTFAISYTPVTSGQVASVSDGELPMHLNIISTGTWSSPHNSSLMITRTIRAVVRLMPRLPGRTVRAGDVATATDLSVNSSGYQATLPYTLTTTSQSSTSLTFDPGTRVEGSIWTRRISLFNSESWSSTIRGTMLTEIGNQYGSGSASTFSYPHPLNGPVTFTKSPASSVITDLSQLKTTWSTTTNTPSVSTLNSSAWLTYCLYKNGPTYQATVLQGSLSNVTLAPSTSNPLGIFVRTGSLDVYDQVSIQGTLVVTGTLNFWGQGTVTSYNWYGSNGTTVVSGAGQWPRLPAVLAKTLNFSNQATVVIEGPVIVDGQLSGGGADYNLPAASQVSLSGTATAVRGQQPYSTVSLNGSPDLSSLTGNQTYAIWLAKGTTGRWYPIQSVDNTAKTLTVLGEAVVSSPVMYRIRLNLTDYVSMNGPVVAGDASFDNEEMWQVYSIIWSNTYNNWTSNNNYLQSHGQARISFCDWVTNPSNLSNLGWFIPYQTSLYGLQLQPTVSLQPTSGINYLGSPPLFTPYSSSGADASSSGYRWSIVDWREDI